MLVEFSVANFRSIKDKVTLSLVASSEKTHPDNTFTDPSGKLRLLKSAAIYGANASGKSNIIKALETMRRLVMHSHLLQRGDKLDVSPFRLDLTSAQEPTEFEVVFLRNQLRYVYGFRIDQRRVREEWLTEADLRGTRVASRVLFRRQSQEDGSYAELGLGEHWKPRNTALWRETNDNALFLPKAAQNNHPQASVVFDWLRLMFRPTSPAPERAFELELTAQMCEDDAGVKTQVLDIVREADLGIDDFFFEPDKPRDLSSGEHYFTKGDPNGGILDVPFRVVTRHQMGAIGKVIDLDLAVDESDGTKRLFSLAGPLVMSLAAGGVMFCDELDSSLHPMLTRALVEKVHRHAGKPFQFIFTTHDCSLLDADLFRRDQIWFTEKNREMATDLYSLWDIKDKPRSDENLRKGYLAGRYGAIPFLGDFSF